MLGKVLDRNKSPLPRKLFGRSDRHTISCLLELLQLLSTILFSSVISSRSMDLWITRWACGKNRSPVYSYSAWIFCLVNLVAATRDYVNAKVCHNFLGRSGLEVCDYGRGSHTC